MSLASIDPYGCLSAETKDDGNKQRQQKVACTGADNRRY